MQDATTKQYVDSRKPLITIWAQENGPLNTGEYEWSFGSGDLYTLKNCGYCMPASGRILRGSLSGVSESGAAPAGNTAVRIVKNGRAIPGNILTRPGGYYSYTQTFTSPTRVAKNDRINFQTYVGTTDTTNNIVSLLIELDL